MTRIRIRITMIILAWLAPWAEMARDFQPVHSPPDEAEDSQSAERLQHTLFVYSMP